MKDFEFKTADPVLYGLLKDYAAHNRKHATEAENILWELLRGRQMGLPFRRQHIIGEFIADFICIPSRLIIELDGGYHQLPNQQVSDIERQQWLEQHGFKVIRFTNEEVISNTERILKIIKDNLKKNNYEYNK